MLKAVSDVFGFFEEENKLSWFIAIIGAILIFWCSAQSFGKGTAGTNLFSIIYHIIAFFFFALFLIISISQGKSKRLVAYGVIISLIYAISDEFHQYFVPGRSCNLFDFGLDSAGITLALLSYLIIILYKEKCKT